MPFGALNEDIVLNVLALCDVYTVLSVSAVNKSLRRVAFVKQLWLSLVRDLTFRGLLELPPLEYEELERQSTLGLIHLVKHAVVKTSRLPESSSRAAQLHHQRLEFPDHTSWKASLLPGARYAVLTTPTHLHIYDVWNGRHIWTRALYPGTRHSVDMAPGGAILRVLLQAVLCTICIQEVDVATGQSWEVFTFDVQDAYQARIAGDFFACNLRPLNGKMSFLLVNWAAATWTILDPGPHLPHTDLLPDYVVLAYPDSATPHQLFLAVADLHSLSPDMKPLHEFNRFDDTNRRSIRDVFVACTGLEHADGQPFIGLPLTVRALASLVHRDSVDVVVTTYESPPPPPSLAVQLVRLVKRSHPPDRLQHCYRFIPAPPGGSGGCLSLAVNRRTARRVQISTEREQGGNDETFFQVVLRYN